MRPNAASVDRYGALMVWDAGRGVLSHWSLEDSPWWVDGTCHRPV